MVFRVEPQYDWAGSHYSGRFRIFICWILGFRVNPKFYVDFGSGPMIFMWFFKADPVYLRMF